MLTRVTPARPPELEAIVTRIIGCAIEVHKALGPGFTEGIYQDALAVELEVAGLRFDKEVEIVVFHRGRALRKQRLDLVVDGAVVIEIKAVERLHSSHQAQLLSYMKAGQLPAGLLMNFHAGYLKSELRRFVL